MIRTSKKSVTETIENLSKAIEAHGLKIFSLIDHGKEAIKADMHLSEEQLIVFGDPKVGTFLMQENPLIGIELPLKILVWSAQEHTQIAYPNVLLWEEKFGISKQLPILKNMMELFNRLVQELKQ